MSAGEQWIVNEFALSEVGWSRLRTENEIGPSQFTLSFGFSERLIQKKWIDPTLANFGPDRCPPCGHISKT